MKFIKYFISLFFIIENIVAIAQYTGGGGDGYAQQYTENKLPVGKSFEITMNENSSYTFNPSNFKFTDADGFFSGIQIIGLETGGDLEYQKQNVQADMQITDVNQLVFKTLTNQYGFPYAHIYFKVLDNEGGKSLAADTITINVIKNPLSSNMHLPVNEDDTLSIKQSYFNLDFGQNRTFNYIVLKSLPTKSIFKYNGNTAQIDVLYDTPDLLTYIPYPDSNGISYDQFSYRIVDDKGFYSDTTYKVFFDVTPMPDPPVSADTSIVFNEDEVFNFSQAKFAFSDIDGDLFSGLYFQILPGSGTLIYNSDTVQAGDSCRNIALLEYHPPKDAFGSPFTSAYFKVLDSQGQLSNAKYKLDFNILPIQDNPTSSDTSIGVNEDEIFTFSNQQIPFADVDGDQFAGIKITTIPTKGVLQQNDNTISSSIFISDLSTLSFLSAANEYGENYTQFKFQVKDAAGNYSAEHTLIINVASVNDLPTSHDFSRNIFEDTRYYFNSKDLAYFDADGDSLLGLYFISLPARGHLYLNDTLIQNAKIYSPADSIYFISNLNEYGSYYAQFKFKVVDAQQGLSDQSYTVTFHVDNSPDAPISADFTADFYEDSLQSFVNLDIPFTDADKNVLKGVILTQIPQKGTLTYNNKAAQTQILYNDLSLLKYIPEKDSNGIAYDSIIWKVVDNSSSALVSDSDYTCTLDVLPVNDPPYALELSDNHIAEDQPIGSTIGYFKAYDIDSKNFNFKLTDSPDLSDADNKSFDIIGNALITQINLDYESQYLYSIFVSVIDDGLDTLSNNFLVYIDDVYENGIAVNTQDKFVLYPNPAINDLFIKTPSSKIIYYHIYNLNGQTVVPMQLMQQKRINIGQLKPGSYIFELFSNGKAIRKLFVKE